ncbi:UPF0029-domain-containing protein [Fomitiporia mediterranea MF3/22]|uniref:UPF0029-domain-containing protein n=1 Tax=Fomitiporia mediterranea (strain MF3/22) TaxID=694068 RepID=UPI0004409288|nr:UPF0029-domain-containing protein [Fomitiporia mediterranea MF3/22]EJD01342.1 UPF0029-domain-containing protein [Fomitiporia mediterranea MF3/22]
MSSNSNDIQDDEQELDDLLANLSLDPAYDQIVTEIGALRSIYGEGSNDSIRVWKPTNGDRNGALSPDDKASVRYEVHLRRVFLFPACLQPTSYSNLYSLPPPHSSPENKFKVLVSLPSTYPSSSRPQLQLLSKYIGPFSVDSNLFGSVLRTFISSQDGVEWTPGTECIFDGLENVRERVAKWFEGRVSEEAALNFVREDEAERINESKPSTSTNARKIVGIASKEPEPLPKGLVLSVSEPIVDRKSVFVGRACRISDPSQVTAVLTHLMSDKRIARAAHPIINAWRCKVNGTLHQDNDDDGETAAGGRLAHLLQILDVTDVLVIVTRYFGGIHLGPDRFKHINQAARNALDLGGYLDAPLDESRKNSSRLKKKG